ncbi:UDP-N-acetylmuramate dehydrogenase [Alkaliflexus imshenetskii]|uniref:UDP-N-acetylmuramate dehydrogenase n=1 Tax=Alkaliflexus imshenetskii TaxID=286730 RepID=UPI000479737C|nr:UDP-N-acetylmuramate dehydrogenase [Alkaliflexus imshenetskii]
MIHYKNYNLKPHNTFGIDAVADDYFAFDSVSELMELISSGKLTNQRILLLGGGSNLLFTDDFKGVVLHNLIPGIEVISENSEEVLVKVGAGVVWDDLVLWCVSKDYYGIENLSLIPGNVGASPVQNIGAYGVELKDLFHTADVVWLDSGETQVFEAHEAEFGYRNSIFKSGLKDKVVITHVTLRLSKVKTFHLGYGSLKDLFEKNLEEPNLVSVRNAIISIRQSKLPDPEEYGNAGSFFKNPLITIDLLKKLQIDNPNIPFYESGDSTLVKVPAGWLIEKAGWKGHKAGFAGVHAQQALVLINLGGATGSDIIRLAQSIEQDIKAKFGIVLEREVNVVG